MVDKRLKSHFYWPLFWVTIALAAIGFLNLYSTTYNLSTSHLSPLFVSQMIWFGIGSSLVVILLLIDYRILIQLSYPLYFFSVLLLVAVLLFGKEVSGNRNWLVVGPLTIQPSEFAKIAFLIVMARHLAENPSGHGYSLKELVRPALLLMVPLVLIIAGKDIGSSLFLSLSFASLVLFSGVRRRVIWVALLLGLVGGVGVYTRLMSGHQRARIETFLHPDEDLKGRGYHLLQSKITVGSGRIWGKGYLKGINSKLLYLPDRHTDFIFPALAEEWGFVGSTIVLALYLSLLTFGIQIASKAKERFGIFLALGITTLIFWQIVINLGGVLGLIPLTGVTLPLLSYGGSSMVTILLGIGLLMNIAMRRFMF